MLALAMTVLLHPFHYTVTELELNPKTKSVELSIDWQYSTILTRCTTSDPSSKKPRRRSSRNCNARTMLSVGRFSEPRPARVS